MKHITAIRIILLLTYFILNSSCEKFLEVDPPKDKITPTQVFENDATATSAITGIYSRMTTSGFTSGDRYSIAVLSGLSADELKSHNAVLDEFYQTEILSSSSSINLFWSNAYSYIYSANAILEGLPFSTGISEATKKQVEGEAKFIRAFCYFYLINLFGEVPLNLTTDYRINAIAKKSPTDVVYRQIISDLSQAEELLPITYVSMERIRPNKWAAKSLLSRVYLYTENWAFASQKATEVIDQIGIYSLVDDLDKVFLKNSSEAIWQLMPPAGGNTKEGNLLILLATPTMVSLRPEVFNLFSDGDLRKLKWIKEFTNSTGKYYYPFKYKVKMSTTITEYSMVMRLAELYLIRSESMAKLGQVDQSLKDINVIRKRAGLVIPLNNLSQAQCLEEIEKQRLLEFFSEWGHRWLDLKRTNRAEVLLSILKGSTWRSTDLLYPIPANEVNRNPNITQNNGY